MERNIVLVGMRGSGKTTVGRALAAALERPFLDLDDEVARLAGCSADELLATRGEPAFRAVEVQGLQHAAALRGHVIATGGGAVLHPQDFSALAATGIVVYLQAPAELLLERGARRPRPALTELPPAQEVAALLARRDPLYRAAAQIIIPAGGADPILALLEALRERDES
jgi:shikimate kinase